MQINCNRLGRVKDQHLDGKSVGICKIEKARTDMLVVCFEQLPGGDLNGYNYTLHQDINSIEIGHDY